jgi:hypothetical protein
MIILLAGFCGIKIKCSRSMADASGNAALDLIFLKK